METQDLTAITTDRLESTLITIESRIAAGRHLQMRLLGELDQRQVPIGDGARSLCEWVAARIDVAPETARHLTQTAVRLTDQPDLAEQLEEGRVSFDRVVEETRLVTAGADPQLIAMSRGFDIPGLRRMVARHQRITRQDEQLTFQERFFSIQPSLDQTSYRMWGQLPGTDGQLVERALQERADRFPTLPNGKQCARSQRHADALVSIAQDTLDDNQTENQGSSAVPLVSIFVDAELAARTNGEAGAEIATGPRIGPLTLEEILCDGKVEILATTPDGTPLTVGPTSRTIPPKLKRFILHRDGGACTADGCQSRYRLQPHHITPRSQGGTHQPDNLTTLCWYHHHIIIHRQGHQIDPNTPPQKRRFLKPHGPDPP